MEAKGAKAMIVPPKTVLVSAIASVGALVLFLPAFTTARRAVVTQPPSAQDREIDQRREKAWKEGGLRAAAAVTGTYLLTRSANDLSADSIDFLIQHSPVIVVGRVLANRTWLNARGDLITTDYQVAVEQALKGPARPADRLTVSLPGGKIAFDDGSSAEVRITDMMLPLNDERYVLFLRDTRYEPGSEQRRASSGRLYMPSFGAVSLYRVSERGFITPKTFSGHRLYKKYVGQPEREFIDDIMSAVTRAQAR